MATLTATSHAAIVSSMYDDFKQGNIPHLLEQVTDHCEWNVMGAPVLPHGGQYTGKANIGRFFATMNDHFEFLEFIPQSINEISDDEVVSLGKMTVRSRATGKTASSNWAMHIRFKNEMVVYFQDFYDSVKLAGTLN